MVDEFKQKKDLWFMELYFRFISLLFWPIYWYKWTVISIENYNNILFKIYFVIDVFFMILLFFRYVFRKVYSKRYFLYAGTTAFTYLISLLSFMIYPRNVALLYLKISMCIFLIYVSWKLVKKNRNDTGVVGIMAGCLLLILTYFY